MTGAGPLGTAADGGAAADAAPQAAEGPSHPPLGTELLEARAVGVRFGGLVALAGVDIAIRRREIFGLIGPNGAGKSTTVNVLSGFQQPTEGEVLIDGRSIRGWSAHRVARSGVARTFQAARLFPGLTVVENVVTAGLGGGGSLAAIRGRALEILAWMGCADRATTLAGELSYGDQRRIGIARALALGPKFVLLDEPAAGMNERECDGLVALIASIPERWGCGVLLIEHNMGVVMRTCGRILVLDGGRPIAEGTPRAIQADPEVRRAYLGDRHAKAAGARPAAPPSQAVASQAVAGPAAPPAPPA